MLADNTAVSMPNSKPSLVDTKTSMFKKAQKKGAKIGAEPMQKQDQAMWSTLSGAFNRKRFLAVTLCVGVLHGASGHSTSLFVPIASAFKCDYAGVAQLNEVAETEGPSYFFFTRRSTQMSMVQQVFGSYNTSRRHRSAQE